MQICQAPSQVYTAAAPAQVQPFQHQESPVSGDAVDNGPGHPDSRGGIQFRQPFRFRRKHFSMAVIVVEFYEETLSISANQNQTLVDTAAPGLLLIREFKRLACRLADG